MFIGNIFLSFLAATAAAAAADDGSSGRANLRSSSSEACDNSFPLARVPSPKPGTRRLTPGTLLPIPPADQVESAQYYETGHYYGPLCDDGKRIDIRRLEFCTGGSCWDESVNVSL